MYVIIYVHVATCVVYISQVFNVTFCTVSPHSIPAPLFYNDDDTPDIFLRVNIGEWDDYEYSYVVIIDGTDGKALWAMNSSYATMQSAVTLMSVNHSQDAVVFFAYNAIDTNDINSAMTKKRQADSDQQGTPLNDGEVPPSSMPFQTDSNQQGTPSYDGEVPPSSMPFQIDSDQQGEEPPSNMGIPPDIQNLNFKHLDEQFWNLSHASFPDPLVDPKGFMESCKYQSTMEQQCYLYLITRNLTTDNDNVDPVAATFPAILSKLLNIYSLRKFVVKYFHLLGYKHRNVTNIVKSYNTYDAFHTRILVHVDLGL